jgi:hypothetical protein
MARKDTNVLGTSFNIKALINLLLKRFQQTFIFDFCWRKLQLFSLQKFSSKVMFMSRRYVFPIEVLTKQIL